MVSPGTLAYSTVQYHSPMPREAMQPPELSKEEPNTDIKLDKHRTIDKYADPLAVGMDHFKVFKPIK